MAKKPLEEMTVAQLNEEIQALMAKRAELKVVMSGIARIRDRKMAQEAAEAKVAAMGDDEKEALLQVLRPQGIPSEEMVQGVGSA